MNLDVTRLIYITRVWGYDIRHVCWSSICHRLTSADSWDSGVSVGKMEQNKGIKQFKTGILTT
jgi:hypothetical protein